jgi:hypothetical protein
MTIMSMITVVTSVIITSMVVPLVVMVVITASVISAIVMVTMLFLIAWGILVVVPVVLYKIDTFVTGTIFVTVLCPMPAMAGWYTQIYGFSLIVTALDYSRLAIVDLWLRIVADIKAPIKSGLANAN